MMKVYNAACAGLWDQNNSDLCRPEIRMIDKDKVNDSSADTSIDVN